MTRNVNRLAERNDGSLFHYDSLAEAFPDVNPGLEPFGDRVLVQIRTPKKESAGGIIIPADAQETELWNTQVAKVIAIGPTCFRNQDTMELWQEGAWCAPGEFVRVPKYGGDRWQVPLPGRPGEFALFVVFKEMDLTGKVTVDPLSVVAYIF